MGLFTYYEGMGINTAITTATTTTTPIIRLKGRQDWAGQDRQDCKGGTLLQQHEWKGWVEQQDQILPKAPSYSFLKLLIRLLSID